MLLVVSSEGFLWEPRVPHRKRGQAGGRGPSLLAPPPGGDARPCGKAGCPPGCSEGTRGSVQEPSPRRPGLCQQAQ